jgi:hypothetical protein
MIPFYFMIVSIVIGSIIVSVIITYFMVKLIFLIGERYISFLCQNPKYKTGTKGNYINEPFNFIIFLKCIYNFLHLNNIYFGIRYPFGKPKVNPQVYAINYNKQQKCDTENYNRSPKSPFHETTISGEDNDINQKQTEP